MLFHSDLRTSTHMALAMATVQGLTSASTSCGVLPRLSPGAWDTHVHVFDSTIGSFAPDRAYTPAEAPLPDLLEFSRTLTQDNSLTNLVIVQPSPYGTDNTVLLEVLRQLHAQGHTARGVAVVDVEKTSDEQFWCLHHAGIRGLRLNKRADEDTFSPQELAKNITKVASRIKNLPGWKLQLFISGDLWDGLYDALVDLPVQVIADHLGGMLGSSKLGSTTLDPTKQRGFDSLMRLAEQSRVFVKVSGLYRISAMNETGYDDLEPIVRTFAEKVPDRLIYGSDWPHTGDASGRTGRNSTDIEEFRKIDDELVIANLKRWIRNEKTWNKMLVTTPGQVFR
ncbi:hypothetical protein DL769_005692 [Monosporascus sp. CRB-8-3]|nr:hypothetical protein DL769_005692 [Monosporascus sp. CRB-8-3]